MAMTAWLAKFVDQLDLLVGKEANLLAIDEDGTDELALLHHRYGQHSSGTRQLANFAPVGPSYVNRVIRFSRMSAI